MNSSNAGLDSGVAVWYVGTSGIDASAEAACATLLDESERRRLHRIGSETRRREFRIGRALLRTTLSRYVDRAARDWTFRVGSHGKPAIESGSELEPMQFSLSHTSGMIVCAVSRRRTVGVDVERRDRPSDPTPVAARWFSAEEAARIAKLPGGEQRDLFLRLWTLKEACLKARGSGFAISPRRVIFDVAAEGAIEVRFPDGLDVEDRWEFGFVEPDETHGIAVAVRSKEGSPPLSISWIETDPLDWRF